MAISCVKIYFVNYTVNIITRLFDINIPSWSTGDKKIVERDYEAYKVLYKILYFSVQTHSNSLDRTYGFATKEFRVEKKSPS